jgi:hypothetical protein
MNIFEQKTQPDSVKKIKVSMAVEPFGPNINEDIIIHRLAEKIVGELLTGNYIRFHKKPPGMDPFGSDIYVAEFNAVPLEYTHGFFPEDVFVHKNNDFTINELKEAVENTFPERFL